MSELKVTKGYPYLEGRQYLAAIGRPDELVDTVLGGIVDGRRRVIVLNDSRTLPVPQPRWSTLRRELYYQAESKKVIEEILEVPPVLVLLNSIVNLLNSGVQQIDNALDRLKNAALLDFSRIVRKELLRWKVTPAVRGTIVRLDQLSRSEVGLNSKDLYELGWRDGQQVHAVRYPVASRNSIKIMTARSIENLGGIGFRSDVIEKDLLGDVDGDTATVWTDLEDIGKRSICPPIRKREEWSGFKSTSSLNNIFYRQLDPIEALADKRAKGDIGPATICAQILARTLTITGTEPSEAYSQAYDNMGLCFELAFDKRKGDSKVSLSIEDLISSLYGFGNLPVEAMKEQGINTKIFTRALMKSNGNILSKACTSLAFRAFVARRRQENSALNYLNCVGWEDISKKILSDILCMDKAASPFVVTDSYPQHVSPESFLKLC